MTRPNIKILVLIFFIIVKKQADFDKHNISLTDTQKPLMIKGFFTFKLKPIYN